MRIKIYSVTQAVHGTHCICRVDISSTDSQGSSPTEAFVPMRRSMPSISCIFMFFQIWPFYQVFFFWNVEKQAYSRVWTRQTVERSNCCPDHQLPDPWQLLCVLSWFMAHKRTLVLCPVPYIQPSQQALLVCSGDPVFVSEIILQQIFWPFVTQGWSKMMTAAD